MKTPEEFMASFFESRTANLRKQLECYRKFRPEFFTEGCLWDSREDDVSRSQSEEIVAVTMDGDLAKVSTIQYPKSMPKLRYSLKLVAASWKIYLVEFECQYCYGNDNQCIVCKGAGWLGQKFQHSRDELGSNWRGRR